MSQINETVTLGDTWARKDKSKNFPSYFTMLIMHGQFFQDKTRIKLMGRSNKLHLYAVLGNVLSRKSIPYSDFF